MVVEEGPHHETNLVVDLMKKHGIDNVRGGIYSKVMLSREERKQVRVLQAHAEGRCLGCGGLDHFVGACPQAVSPKKRRKSVVKAVETPAWMKKAKREAKVAEKKEVCERCGRDSHSIQRCYARTHQNGRPLDPSSPTQPSFMSSSSDDESEQQEVTEGMCERCGRHSTSASQCMSLTSADGTPIDVTAPYNEVDDADIAALFASLSDDTSSRSTEETGGRSSSQPCPCCRCGRLTHAEDTCTESTHVDGFSLYSLDHLDW
jgi:uncharacterized cysteine cluster protein YcgN (CxxCxxCC family)